MYVFSFVLMLMTVIRAEQTCLDLYTGFYIQINLEMLEAILGSNGATEKDQDCVGEHVPA